MVARCCYVLLVRVFQLFNFVLQRSVVFPIDVRRCVMLENVSVMTSYSHTMSAMCFSLAGQLPFIPKNGESIESRIKTARFDFEPAELWRSISLQPIDLIKGMLKANYQHRPFADAVLTHPWFKKVRIQNRCLYV